MKTSIVARPLVAAALAALLVSACSLLGGGPTPTPGPKISTPEEAVDLVLAQDARFAGIGRRDPNVIGQANWFEVGFMDGGWKVTVRIGWGDCPAGCISEHVWVYGVLRDGNVQLLSETGDPLPQSRSGVTGQALSGPTCSVVQDPPDPACADRPVSGAVLVVLDGGGSEVARATTDVQGGFTIDLEPGTYTLVPQPVEGLMGTPAPIPFTVTADEPLASLTVSYDTGIR